MFIVSGSILFGQENEKESKISLGILTYSNISNGFTVSNENETEYYKGIKSTVFSYSFGFKSTFQITDKVGLSTGLLYMKTGDQSLIFPPDPQRGLFSERHYKHKEHYLELPLNVEFKIKQNWLLTFGTSFLFNVTHRGLIFIGDSNNGYKLDSQTFENSKIGLTANLGFGYTLNVGNQKLEILPYLQYNFINPIEQFAYIDWVPSRTFGSCGLQLNYLFSTK